MNLADLLSFARALPGVCEKPHHDLGSLRVRDRIFLTWPADDSRVHIFVDPERAAALAHEHPDVCSPLHWGAQIAGLRVVLPADAAKVEAWTEEAWARRAPARLVKLRRGF